jgi:hypothetical protein
VSARPSDRCSDVSRAVREPLVATAATTERWILVEVAGSWPRDVSIEGPLPERTHAALSRWLSATPRSRLLFVRRPGRSKRQPVAFAVRSEEGVSEVRRIGLRRLADLADADLDADGEPVDTRLVLVCGHGSRDECCALRGTPVFGALAAGFDDDELWISSHQGGHRFAGNVLILPAAIQLGRIDPDNARSVMDGVRGGRIALDHYRGRTYYEALVQAAEHAIREATGLDGFDDLHLAAVDGSLVRFRDRDGNPHDAAVEEAEGPVIPASCGAPPEPQTVYRARVI